MVVRPTTSLMQNRVRVLFASDTTRPASHHTVPPPAQRTSSLHNPLLSSPSFSSAWSASLSAATSPHSLVLEQALAETIVRLPQAEKAAFAQASKTTDERTLLSRVQTYDAAHKRSNQAIAWNSLTDLTLRRFEAGESTLQRLLNIPSLESINLPNIAWKGDGCWIRIMRNLRKKKIE
jgi:hypothetical protein